MQVTQPNKLKKPKMTQETQQTLSTQQTGAARPKVLAAIPCFNTEPFIADVATKTKKYVDQVIVIDDGSIDGTAEAAKAAGATVISHGMNKGYGEATKSCFAAAKANAADVLVTLDGDGQHNPDEIPSVLSPVLNKEADLVIGSRFLQPTQPSQLTKPSQPSQPTKPSQPSQPTKPSQPSQPTKPSQPSQLSVMPPYRAVGIGIITSAWNFGSKTKVSDAQSSFRAYSKKAMDAFDNLTEKGMSISVETLEKARRKRAVITEVPISCKYVPSTLNLGAFRHGFSVARAVVKIRLKSSLHRLGGGDVTA